MRLAGVPLWTLVLVACAIAPFVLRAWVDAEQRRAKIKTLAMLQQLDPQFEPGRHRNAAGPAHAASSGGDPRDEDDERQSEMTASGGSNPPAS